VGYPIDSGVQKPHATITHAQYTAQVVLGELFGYRSTVPTLSPAYYDHLKLKPDPRLDIPTHPGLNAFGYTVTGSLELEEQKMLAANQIALYERGEPLVRLYTREAGECFVLGGQPLNEPVYSYGPFVMNSREEIK